MPQYDLVIIGAGAAGLMAAASAVQIGKRVLLLEKNAKLGVKILMSGGSRCNITHACDAREIVRAFGKQGQFLHSALAALSPDAVIQLIESQGVKTKVEPGGKIFPVSDRAIDVRDALVKLACDSNQPGYCTILTDMPCRAVEKQGDGFNVATDSDRFNAPSLLITTGGKSYPGCGTTGDGYVWAKSLGHKIIPPVPALTPIVNSDVWTHALKGLAFDNVRLDILDADQKKLDSRSGAMLFTHFGYSGPAALDISRTISLSPHQSEMSLSCDFEPDLNRDQLKAEMVKQLQAKSRQTIFNVLSGRYPKRFCEGFLSDLQIGQQQKAAELKRTDLNGILDRLKQSRYPISGVYGFKKAEVTAGGVDLNEVDSRTMQSKICQGLYFAGEVLDLDGPIGGYNFQAAFSTGWLAAMNA